MKFGTSGLRGLVTDLKGRTTALYTDAFVRHMVEAGHLNPGGTVLVARDFRSSSPSIAATVIATLRNNGFNPVNCGAIPTPALALLGLTRSAPCMMVTGSHIPDDRNGIKFYRPDGEIDKADESRIGIIASEIAEAYSSFVADNTDIGAEEEPEATSLFLDRYYNILSPKCFAGLRIGVYQHSTVARDLLVNILKRHGAHVLPLGRSDHFVPVDTEAVSADTVSLMTSWTREHRLDAIVSADGDGDRPLVSDELGNPLRGDLIGLISGLFLQAKVIVTPVTSNSHLESAGTFSVVRTKVGSPFVIAAMMEAEASGKTRVVGFEANGGVLIGSGLDVNGVPLAALPTRDSVLPILAVLAMMSSEGKPLSELASSFHLAHAAAGRLEHFPVEDSQALLGALRSSPEYLANFIAPISPVASVSNIDGIRVSLTNGQTVHFRASGNAPEMRCYVEAEDAVISEKLLEESLGLVLAWSSGREAQSSDDLYGEIA